MIVVYIFLRYILSNHNFEIDFSMKKFSKYKDEGKKYASNKQLCN